MSLLFVNFALAQNPSEPPKAAQPEAQPPSPASPPQNANESVPPTPSSPAADQQEPLDPSPSQLLQPSEQEAELLSEDAPSPIDDLELIPLPDGSELPDLPEIPDDALLPGGSPDFPSIPILPPQREPERKNLARYKALRVQCEKDPALLQLKKLADSAPTYEDHRAALRQYYLRLFQQMRQADASLADTINKMERTHLKRLSQTLVEPTIPLRPPPSIETSEPTSVIGSNSAPTR